MLNGRQSQSANTMGRFGNCCCSCLVHEDLFARGNDDELGGSWCEEPGTYSIDDGAATCDEAGALAILDVQHPEPAGTMCLALRTKDEVDGSGEKYRLLLNLVKGTTGSPPYCTSSNYYFAEFERNGLNDSVIRLGIVSGGVETILKSDLILGLTGLTRTFTAHINEKFLCAGVDSAVLSQVATTHAGLFANGHYSGFSLDTVDMKIDAFRFERYELSDGTLCCSCFCTCDGTEWPPILNVRIYPDPDDCVRLDLLEPCEFTLEYNPVDSTWEGSANCCDVQFWDLEVSCDAYGDELNLVIKTGCTSSCQPCNTNPDPDCDSLCVTFGPFSVAATDLTCPCSSEEFDINDPLGRGSCSYYIEVCG